MDPDTPILDSSFLDQPGTLTTTYGTQLPQRISTRDVPPKKPLKKKAKVASDGAYSRSDLFEDPSDVSEDSEIEWFPEAQAKLGRGSSVPAEQTVPRINVPSSSSIETNPASPEDQVIPRWSPSAPPFSSQQQKTPEQDGSVPSASFGSASKVPGSQNEAPNSASPVEQPVEENYSQKDVGLPADLAKPLNHQPAQIESAARVPQSSLNMSKISVIYDSEPTPTIPLTQSSKLNTMKAAQLEMEMQDLAKLADLFVEVKLYEGDPCVFFRKWPLEIRELVYNLLLVAGHISCPAQLVEMKYTTFVYTESRGYPSSDLGTDPTILQTCRRIYSEALPILYGRNNFHFYHPREIQVFRERCLVELPSLRSRYDEVFCFNFEANPQGRLAMIRKLTIVLADDNPGADYNGHYRDYIMDTWRSFLHEIRYIGGHVWHGICDFPALDDLTLDFTHWDLGSDEGVVYRPFIERFKTPNGLSRLEIKGIKHKRSRDGFRGLLRKRGTFVVTE